MNRNRSQRTRILFATACLGITCWASAQPPAAPRTVTLEQRVEPSFRIEPVVQRFQAERGEVVPFEFLMTSTGREMEVGLKVVALRQEENGTILHREDVQPSAAVRFTSPTQFTLSAGESRKITGEVTVPAIKSNFHSLGILVWDRGREPTFAAPDKAKSAVQAGVRFVTQYVLRCDFELTAGAESDIQQLKLEQGGFHPRDGLPAARVWVHNPTPNAFEFTVRGTIDSAMSGDRPELLSLGMASRASLPEPDRYLVRIMPQSRLLLEAPPSTALVPGDTSIAFAVHNGRREVVRREFSAQIAAASYPALEAAAVRGDQGLLVTPGQLTLSRQKGGKRSLTVRVTNTSDKPQTVDLALESLAGQPLASAIVSTESLQLAPGRGQNIRVTLQAKADAAESQFGYLRLAAHEDAALPATRVPLAVFDGDVSENAVEFAPLEAVSEDGRTDFRVSAKNVSPGFAPVHGELSLMNEFGQRVQLTAGYRRWIRPNDSLDLVFRSENPIPAGAYQATLVLHSFPNVAPRVLTTEFSLLPAANR